MPRSMPQIREFMTPMPHTIGADQPLRMVQEQMRALGVRHLPVKKGGQLIGIISDRNVKEALATPQGPKLAAEDVMIDDPYHVSPEAPLDQVAAAMAEEKYGCALVQEEGAKLVGIFTTVDACRALRQILETVYPQ